MQNHAPEVRLVDPTSAAVADRLSTTARQHLETLRRELDARLSTLEAALTDPTGGVSLEGLIFDLARVATEEAQAAAALACLDVKSESDRHAAQLEAAGRHAVDEERAQAADLRRAIEQEQTAARELRRQLDSAQQRIVALERDRTIELRRIEARHETAIAGERAKVKDIEHELEEMQEQLDGERASNRTMALGEERLAALAAENAQLEAARDRLAAELADHASSVTRQTADTDARCEELTASLARVRELTADHERAGAEAQERLQAEQGENRELRQMLTPVKKVFETFGQQKIAMEARLAALTTELSEARGALARSEEARAIAVEELELQTASHAGHRESVDSQEPYAAPRADVDVDIDGERETPSADEDEWQLVRLANRYALRDPLDIRINGDTGLLADVSVAGCQIVVPGRLTPNQRVKIVLPDGEAPITWLGKVAWARLEPPSAGRRQMYHAGVQFVKPDEGTIEAFIARHALS